MGSLCILMDNQRPKVQACLSKTPFLYSYRLFMLKHYYSDSTAKLFINKLNN